MARPSPSDSTLAQNVEVSGGLQQFRSVAQGSRERRDSPFGPPPKSPIEEPAPEAPKLETVRREPRPPQREPQEPRNAPKKDEAVTEHSSVSPFVENVTVPLSEALRDRSEELAKSINRGRSVRKHRITRNSIIRVALQCFLDDFTLTPNQSVNSEDELLEAARSKRRR